MKNGAIEIKAIKTKKDYLKTMKAIEELLKYPPGSKEEDILEVLSILADDYENKHFPIEDPIEDTDPIEAIKYRMQQMQLSKKDIAKYLGGENRVSEVLSRKRPLTLKMIKNLYQHLHIPAEVLLAS